MRIIDTSSNRTTKVIRVVELHTTYYLGKIISGGKKRDFCFRLEQIVACLWGEVLCTDLYAPQQSHWKARRFNKNATQAQRDAPRDIITLFY